VNKISNIGPISRTQELVRINKDGSRVIRAYSPANPHYFKDAQGVLRPIQVGDVSEAQSTIGDIQLRAKNIVSTGIRKDSNPEKYLGLRRDEDQAGIEQLEFTIERVEFDGKEQKIDLSQNKIISPIAIDLGSVIVTSTRQYTRQAVKVDRPIKSFRIKYKLHLKGLRIEHRKDLDEFWVYSLKGEFRYRIKKPKIIDLITLEHLTNDLVNPFDGKLIKHSLIENPDRTYTYVKEQGKCFDPAILPKSYGIDADTVYSHSDDGYIKADYDTWNECLTATNGTLTRTWCEIECQPSLIDRSFCYYDVSGLIGTAASVKNGMYITVLDGSGDITIRQGTQSQPFAANYADFDSFTGAYFAKGDPDTEDEFFILDFNSAGIAYVNTLIGSGTVKLCYQEYTHDYLEAESGTWFQVNFRGGTGDPAEDPYLEIAMAAGGPPMLLMTDRGNYLGGNCGRMTG